MKPWISRLKVRLAATASSTTCWIDSASSPLARNAVSSPAAAPRDRRRARAAK